MRAKILCIDDDDMVRQMMGDFLKQSGYEVFLAEDGKTGLETFKQCDPDVVLVDLKMPVIDGLEFLKKLRETSNIVPVIVISGAQDTEEAIQALRLGASDYLIKPFEDFDILLHTIHTQLEKSKLHRENETYRTHLEEVVQQRTAELQTANARLKKEMDERLSVEKALYENERFYRSVLLAYRTTSR